MLRIVNGEAITPWEAIPGAAVVCEESRITWVGRERDLPPEYASGEKIDAAGGFILPGLIDLHVHGSGGFDVMAASRDSLASLGRYLAARGTTAWLATTMTASSSRLALVAEAVGGYRVDEPGAELLGMHLEGPYLSRERCGAQSVGEIRPYAMIEVTRLQEISQGRVRLMTIAPEADGNEGAVAELHRLGICVSLGHTDADYAQAMKAFDAGARRATHTFNAMRGLGHRDPGVVGAAIDHPDVCLEVIADGIHVHPACLRLLYRAVGPERLNLITDALPHAGLPAGRYDWGGITIQATGEALFLENGTLAGSRLTLIDAVALMVKRCGVPLADAVRMASLTPAESLGVASRKGSLTPGKDADVVIVDRELGVRWSAARGRMVTTPPTP